jgi:hypothetical protein
MAVEEVSQERIVRLIDCQSVRVVVDENSLPASLKLLRLCNTSITVATEREMRHLQEVSYDFRDLEKGRRVAKTLFDSVETRSQGSTGDTILFLTFDEKGDSIGGSSPDLHPVVRVERDPERFLSPPGLKAKYIWDLQLSIDQGLILSIECEDPWYMRNNYLAPYISSGNKFGC